jgi:hypothetical protein
MIGLFCFVLAVLASPFRSKLRLEAENAVVCTENLIRVDDVMDPEPLPSRPMVDLSPDGILKLTIDARDECLDRQDLFAYQLGNMRSASCEYESP